MDLDKIDAIAIGGFDGMHKAHQKLFSYLGKNGAIVVIETGFANLTPKRYREKYTTYPIIYLNLKDIKHFDANQFALFLKQKFKNLKKIVVGYDFRFGKDRKHDVFDLQNICNSKIVVVDEVKEGDISIHSRTIREYIKNGDIEFANKLLGHNYAIEGKVIKGQGIGKTKLYPTLNISADGFLLPKEGVYATLTRVDDNEHFDLSVSFIGHRISTDGSFAIESYVIEKELNEVKKAEISFLKFIRENEKFESLDKLKQAIKDDIEKAQKILKHFAI